MDYKIASVATKWWIDHMKTRCKELYPDKVIGNDGNLVIVDLFLENELSRFEAILFARILSHVQSNLYLSLTCYFWPSGELGILVRKASISKEYFPQRANMQIYDKCIRVSLDGEDPHILSITTEKV